MSSENNQSFNIKANTGNGQFSDYAYTPLLANKYFRNASQFLYASDILQEKVKSCTSVVWYFQGMSIELVCKGLLISRDTKTYSPKVLSSNKYSHNIEALIEALAQQKVLTITDRQLEAIKQLNNFYSDKKHALRYPALLSIFAEVKPENKYERPVLEVLEKLCKEAEKKLVLLN